MFEEEQKELDKFAPLKLRKNGEKFVLTEDNPTQFIRNFITIYNKDHKTYRGNRIQCREDRNRSFEDIYLLTKNYFPQVSLENVFHFLIDGLFSNTKESWFMGFYYPDVRKVVFYNKKYGYSFEAIEKSEFYDQFLYRFSRNYIVIAFITEILKRKNENLNN